MNNIKTFKQFINEGAMDYLKPKPEEEIRRQLKNLNVFDLIEQIFMMNLPEEYMPTEEEIKEERDKLEPKGKKYADLCDEIFNYLNEMFNDRFFPLRVQLHRHQENYYISIVLFVAWTGRVSIDEQRILDKYILNTHKNNNGIHISIVGSTSAKAIYLIQNDDFPINFNEHRNIPAPLYPNRLR